MSILINKQTRVICQGITGNAGLFHTQGCLEYGTQMVGGVTPGKGGTTAASLPVFDSGQQSFTFNQLFRENRFNGTDRVGDANQASLALTTRLIDKKSGRERLRASIGQIVYFRDRQVTLPFRAVETLDSSDIIAEAAAYFDDGWSARTDLLWNNANDEIDRGAVTARRWARRSEALPRDPEAATACTSLPAP